MRVVLFCGGLGLRLRDYAENIPKPMAAIGYRPILWHVMKYYAHYGHKDFILCLGHRADTIKNTFRMTLCCLPAVRILISLIATFMTGASPSPTPELPLPLGKGLKQLR